MKVSVIIPVYNVESYVEAAIRSVQGQTFQDLEIICVNDASTDRSAQVIRQLAQADSRIRLYENTVNSGAAAARNKGLTYAQGDYIYFLDADDEIVPDALEKLSVKAEHDNLDMISFCARFIYEDPRYEETFGTNHSVFKGRYPEMLAGKELFVLWMQYWDWIPAPPRFFYRRLFLEENALRFPEGLLHEDEIFTFDVLMAAKRTHILNEKLLLRRFRYNSAMTGGVTIRNVEACLHILQHAASCPAVRSDDRLRNAAAFYRKKITEETFRKYAAAGYTEAFLPCGKPPFLSVIIPVYTVENYLADCLESVLCQDFIDFELICIDDGSADRSPEILREYEKMDPRVRVITDNRNRGQACARNKGLWMARGEYVYMMDSDDLIEESTFRTLYACCMQDRPDVIGFENSQFADDPAFAGEAENTLFSYEGREGLYTGRDAFVMLVREDILSPSVPTYLIRRELLERNHIRFTEGLPHEDIGFIFEMLIHARSANLLHKRLYRRRFRAHSTVTGRFSKKRACGYLLSWKKVLDNRDYLIRTAGDDEEYLNACSKWSRDVLGRIRTLYLSSGEYPDLWEEPEGNVPFCANGSEHTGHACTEETGLTADLLSEAEALYAMLCESTSGRGRAAAIFEESTCSLLERLGEVYVCGAGQYMNRILDVAGALDVVIRGILIAPEDQKPCRSIRGFRVCPPEEAADKKTAVILAVSHYRAERYICLLERAGFKNIVRVSF